MPTINPLTTDASKKIRLPAHLFFLIIGITFGIVYCIAIPYGAGFDEETHVVRIFDIAAMHFLPNRSSPEGTPAYGDFILKSYQRRYFLTPAQDLFLPENFNQPINREVTVGFPTRSIYPPVMFFPQAVLARLFWRKYDFPVVPIAILMRMAGLGMYLLGSYLTIRLLPAGKWVFTLLALSPMALFQAATLNGDGFTSAVSFLLIGLTLNIQADPGPRLPVWKAWAVIGVCLLLGTAKPSGVLILPLLFLLPMSKFQSKPLRAAVWGAAALAILFMVGWTILAVPGSHFSNGGGQSIGQQMQKILSQPFDFILTFIKGNILAAGRYFEDWVGVYGHWVGFVPQIIYWLYPLALIAGLGLEPRGELISRRTRLFLAGLFVVSSAATAMLYYYANYTPGDLSIFGRQGRYYIPNAPLLYLALAGLFALPGRWSGRVKTAMIALLGLTLVFYTWGLAATYYSYCGASVYTGMGCSQPVYKNLDVGSAPVAVVNQQTPLTQSIQSVCGNLTTVEIYLKSLPVENGARIIFTLRNSQDAVIASQEFQAGSIHSNAYLMLQVPPYPAQNGPDYQIDLQAEQVDAPQGFGVATSDLNHYREGDLFVAGTPQDTDMIFMYTCSSPWPFQP